MMVFFRLTLLLTTLLTAPSLLAQGGLSAPPYFCEESLGQLPIQQGGRVKPLLVHAQEIVKYLHGKSGVEGLGPVTSYCLLSLKGMGLEPGFVLQHKIEHVKVAELLGYDKRTTIPYEDLLKQADVLRMERSRLKVEDGYQKAVTKALSQAMIYQEVTQAQNWLLPLMNGQDAAWVPLISFLTEERVQEQARELGGSGNPFIKTLEVAGDRYASVHGTKHRVEYAFTRARLPMVSLLLCLVALTALTLMRRFTWALAFSALTVITQTVYLILRVYISGRAPVTNMYETVLFSGYAALILAMGIGHFKKEKVYIYMGLAYNVLCLMMINFAHGMLNPSISPLVPVLRDNFWLSTHVTMVIISYGAYALSWVLANTILFKKRFSTLSKKDELYYSDVIYTCLKWGSVLIIGGILLGGVWADYSWGRFWGWDPKETWSLIVFCLYVAILHGRYTNWIPNHRFVTFTAAAFMSVMMCWFGVNYILASGLHSYGFSEGGAIFLGSFFSLQIIFLLITASAMKPDGKDESGPERTQAALEN